MSEERKYTKEDIRTAWWNGWHKGHAEGRSEDYDPIDGFEIWIKDYKPVEDTDPIAISHEQDPSLAEDEMVFYTFIDPQSIDNKENDNG